MKCIIETNNKQFNDALNFAETILRHFEFKEIFIKNVDTNETFEAYIIYDEDYNDNILNLVTIDVID